MELTDDQKADIARVRILANINESDYDDEAILELLIANNNSVEGAAAAIWRRKAASYAELTDVTEGSSSRKLSTLYKQALEMATSLDSLNAGVIPGLRRTMTRAIERV